MAGRPAPTATKGIASNSAVPPKLVMRAPGVPPFNPHCPATPSANQCSRRTLTPQPRTASDSRQRPDSLVMRRSSGPKRALRQSLEWSHTAGMAVDVASMTPRHGKAAANTLASGSRWLMSSISLPICTSER